MCAASYSRSSSEEPTRLRTTVACRSWGGEYEPNLSYVETKAAQSTEKERYVPQCSQPTSGCIPVMSARQEDKFLSWNPSYQATMHVGLSTATRRSNRTLRTIWNSPWGYRCSFSIVVKCETRWFTETSSATGDPAWSFVQNWSFSNFRPTNRRTVSYASLEY